MNSVATKRLWRCFDALPPDVQRRVEAAYRLWSSDPWHRSLDYKRIHPARPIYSVRIGLH